MGFRDVVSKGKAQATKALAHTQVGAKLQAHTALNKFIAETKKSLEKAPRNQAGNLTLKLTDEQEKVALAKLQPYVAADEGLDLKNLARFPGFTEAITIAVRAEQRGFDPKAVEGLFAKAAQAATLVPTRGEKFRTSFEADFAEGTRGVTSAVVGTLAGAASTVVATGVEAAIKAAIKK